MKRVKCTVAYDGSFFAGYQVQPNKRTVQGEIETALSKLHKGEPIKIFASGRTDAKVHAKGQVIHFDSPLHLPEAKWEKALNSLLPEDIAILESTYVSPNFHARFSVVEKEYRYKIRITKGKDPFLRNYVYHYPYPLNIERMKKGMNYFPGTYDFTSFCSAKTEIEDRVRTISYVDLIKDNEILTFVIRGNGFLYNMVRIIVGTLLEIGSGEKSPDDIPDIIKKMDRDAAGRTAPGHGLYLWKVYYGE